MSDIWHLPSEAPAYCFLCAFYDQNQGLSVGHYNPVKKQFCSGDRRFNHDEIKTYCDIHDLFALETELKRTRKALEQSEICCTEWEKQALDYKAENIALSGDLERTRKALEIAVDALKGIKAYYDDSYGDPHLVNWHIVAQRLANDADDAIKTITALEQKDVK